LCAAVFSAAAVANFRTRVVVIDFLSVRDRVEACQHRLLNTSVSRVICEPAKFVLRPANMHRDQSIAAAGALKESWTEWA
jgi:hypothetical protein